MIFHQICSNRKVWNTFVVGGLELCTPEEAYKIVLKLTATYGVDDLEFKRKHTIADMHGRQILW